ncbi:MAG: hypothetical protein ACOH2A_01070 [Sphingobacteriaceae bacterium]
MKTFSTLLKICLILLVLPVSSFKVDDNLADDALKGAWQFKRGENIQVAILQDNYFIVSIYNLANKNFIDSFGGTYSLKDGSMSGHIEFSGNQKEMIGQDFYFPVTMKANSLTINREGSVENWEKIDSGEGALAGNWRITSRDQDGKMNPIPLNARRTLKILSGTRFQWAAINNETGELFGTGGGTYTFKNGKYTEKIEFFPKDNSRVGASLSFDGKVEGNNWDHAGLSSKGDKIHEVWSRFK